MSTSDVEIAALAETLRSLRGADDDRDWSKVREFWAREPQRSLEPAAIRNPDEYDGGERLAIACTQTDLPAREQCRLVARWCEALPGMTGVRWLYFASKLPQDLFEAACALPALEALCIKWSAIERLDPLLDCHQLRHLKIGSSPGIASVESLGRLTQLHWLQLDNIKAATSLEPFAALTELEGFGFTGAEFKNFAVETFAPLAALTQLKWLHLGSVRARDDSLLALRGLTNLEFLGIGNFFPMAEFARLSRHLDSSVCERLAPYVRLHSSVFPCGKCRKNWKVQTSGKGGKLLCPTCDAVKLARHVLQFQAARAAD